MTCIITNHRLECWTTKCGDILYTYKATSVKLLVKLCTIKRYKNKIFRKVLKLQSRHFLSQADLSQVDFDKKL